MYTILLVILIIMLAPTVLGIIVGCLARIIELCSSKPTYKPYKQY